MKDNRSHWFRQGTMWATLLCCGLLSPQKTGAQIGWGPNRVSNASFEEQLDYWNPRIGARHDGPEVYSDVKIDATMAKSGVYSLRLSGDASVTRWWAIESEPIPATPGKRYRFGAYMKAEDVVQEEGQYLNANVYIQFRDDKGQVLEMGNATVRGTQPLTGTREWMNLYGFVVAPPETAQARIGSVLTCSGSIWFDDITLQESEDVTWASKRTKNFAYFYALGETPPDDALEENERVAEGLLRILGVKPGEQILFFKYKDSMDMQDTRSFDSRAGAATEGVHSIRWTAPPFTVSRILARRWGDTTKLIDEGLATYATDALVGTDFHARARELAREGSLPVLFEEKPDTAIELGMWGPRRNPIHGSFVGWLIQAQGIDQFKKIYSFDSIDAAEKELPEKFKGTYGMSLEEAEAEWRKFLRGE